MISALLSAIGGSTLAIILAAAAGLVVGIAKGVLRARREAKELQLIHERSRRLVDEWRRELAKRREFHPPRFVRLASGYHEVTLWTPFDGRCTWVDLDEIAPAVVEGE